MIGPACHGFGITGYGNPEYGVVGIGIAPGRDEVKTGRPFTGPSGRLFDASLASVGWSRDKVYATNIICWYNDKPNAEHIAACTGRLTAELKLAAPKLIITLGEIATEAILGENTFGRWRGSPQYSDKYHCYIMPTNHPSAVLHGGSSFIYDIVRDLQKIHVVLGWSGTNGDASFEYRVVESKNDAQAFLDSIEPAQVAAVDIETDSREVDEIDPYSDTISCLSVATEYETVVFPAEVCNGLTWPLSVDYLFQNGPFDRNGIRRNYNTVLPITWDTLLESYLLDERGGIHKLKQQAREWLGAGYYEAEVRALRKAGKAIPSAMLYKYNAADSTYTYRLHKLYMPRIIQENLLPVYQNILLPASNVLADVMYRGVHISEDEVQKLALDWFPKYLDAETSLQAMANEYGWIGPLNLNSPLQIQKFLFEVLSLPIIKYTKGGKDGKGKKNPSTDKEVLEELYNQHPFVAGLVDHRHLGHQISNYILGVQGQLKVDQRLHPTPLLHGTTTGRLAYTKPPINTIPTKKVSKEYGRARDIFEATDENYVIVEADYKIAEVWNAYAYCRDPQMLADLLSGDYHLQVSSEIYSKPAILLETDIPNLSGITPHERRDSKYVTFGILFGRQAEALAKAELNCTPKEAQAYIDRWLGRYPKYVEWATLMKKLATEEGELVSKTGRKRRFPLIIGKDAYHLLNQSINFPIQGTSHDMVLTSMIELHELLKELDSYILFEVHDSLVFEVAKKYLPQVVQLIRSVMERPRFDDWPSVPVDISVGRSWGLVKEYAA